MKKLMFSLAAVGALMAVEARGQEPTAARRNELDRPISLGELKPTPEMWFYEQELRRYEDPRTLVRRKAEFRAAQRQRRIESRKWFGLSNARPDASPEPMYGSYSPRWNSGNVYDPFGWSGRAPTYMVVRPHGTRPTW